jgi:hypothetical protein
MDHTRAAGYMLAALLLAVPVKAELIVGLTTQNSLITFDSSTPGSVSSAVAIVGLVSGDQIAGIDRRASPGANNRVLYAFAVNGGTGRIYTVDATIGTAVLASTLVADPSDTTAPFPFSGVLGSSFGVDFNPVPDRLRVVSDTGQNLRINVDNGLTQLDGPLAYAAGDPNFGTAPNIQAVAYTNSVVAASSTALFGIDISKNTDLLVQHTNPNGGVLASVAPLSFNSSNLIGYDISGLTGSRYFSVNSGTGGASSFYVDGALVGSIGGGVPVADIAAMTGVPEPGTILLSALGLLGVVVARVRGGARGSASRSQATPAHPSQEDRA